MPTVQISARIAGALKNAIDEYCRAHRVVVNDFIRNALLIRLEELKDAKDLTKIRHEPTRPLAEVLAELKLDGTS